MLLYNTKSPGNVQYLGNTHKACNRSDMLQYDMDNDLLDHILFNMILIMI